jgi:hypothetical protein
MSLCNNLIFNNTVSIVVQVFFIFCFLVIFYFLYVIKVEQDEFKNQLELIIDSLLEDTKEQLNDIIKNEGQDKIDKNDYEILIYGIIDSIEEKVSANSQKQIEDINNSNRKLRNNVYAILISVLIIISILLLYFNCLPVNLIIKESLITVLFIGITEFIFLKLISERYISADPNRIKYKLGNSIKDWISKNKKLK